MVRLFNQARIIPVFLTYPFCYRTVGLLLNYTLSGRIQWRVEVDEHISTTLIVNGPDGYISPDWYGLQDQVPTWNYVAVHLTGTLVRLDQAELEPILARLSEQFERELEPKPIWTMDKMSDDAEKKMMRQIVPFRFHIEKLHSTWKLGQNKPNKARLSAASALEYSASALAKLMKDVPQ